MSWQNNPPATQSMVILCCLAVLWSVAVLPLPKDISEDYQKIYDLITYRFISLFGEVAEIESIKVDLEIGEEPFAFSRQRISKEGWLSLDPYQYKKVKNQR